MATSNTAGFDNEVVMELAISETAALRSKDDERFFMDLTVLETRFRRGAARLEREAMIRCWLLRAANFAGVILLLFFVDLCMIIFGN